MLERYTLRNGIPVFVVPTSSSPVVSIQAWVSRGSVFETPDIAGVSHFLEHSLFKGTKKRKVGDIALEIESRGGEVNAFTSFEETVYYATLASRYLEDGLDIITDAVQNPSFDPEEMLKEREVILEEIRRAQDSPYKTLSHNLWRTAFPKSPYGRPVLGFVETVKEIDHKKLRSYFEKHYHADSISLFVVGDVDPGEVKNLAAAKMGRLKGRGKAKIPKVPDYLKGRGIKVVSTGKDVKECNAQLAWLTPALADARVPAMDILATAMGSGESSPLFQHLVKDTQSCLDVSMGLVATARCGMAALGLQVTPENFEKSIADSMTVLNQLAANGLSSHQLERVKSSLEAEIVTGKETVEGYARRLGYYYVQFGDPEYEQLYLEKLLAVDTDSANRALREILSSPLVVSVIHPMDFKVDSKMIERTVKAKAGGKVAVPVKRPVLELKKRGTLRFVEKPARQLPTIAMKILFPGGIREERPGKYGVAQLFQRVWTSGTKHFTSRQMAHTLESLGASLHAFTGRYNTGIAVEFLSKHWPAIKPLLSEVLTCPTFPEDEFEVEKNLQLQEIHSEKDSPSHLCHINFLKTLYGDHPIGRSHLGTKETVENLTIQDLKDFYLDHIHTAKTVISTVGNFDAQEWESEMAEMLKPLPTSGIKQSPFTEPKPITKLQIILGKKQPLFQSHVLIGFTAANFFEEDRLHLKLLSSCLSGQGGRLFLELRDKQSLAYTVAPVASDNPERGIFGVYIGCAPEKLSTAIHGIRSELDKVVAKAMSSKELSRAKEYWTGRFELEMQRYSAQAILYGLDEVYGLGYDHSLKLPSQIKAVTAEQIRATAAKYIQPQRAVISIVHPETVEPAFIEKAWLG